MSIIKTEAFVLKSLRYGETSKIVTLFTKDFGKMSAIIKGGRNFKSRNCGVLETMNYINSVIYYKANREIHLVSSAEYIKSFPNILNSYEKLQASFRIIEMINKSLFVNEINKQIFNLLLKTFEKINNSVNDLLLNFLLFQIELIKIMGLSPDLENKDETFLNSNELSLNRNQIVLLKLIMESDFEDLTEMNFDLNEVNKLIESYERYLLSHTQGSKFYSSKKIILELNQFL